MFLCGSIKKSEFYGPFLTCGPFILCNIRSKFPENESETDFLRNARGVNKLEGMQ